MGNAPRSGGIGAGLGRAMLSAGLDRAMLAAAILAGAGIVLLIVALPILIGSQGWAYDFRPYFDAATRITQGASPYLPINLSGPYTQGEQYYGYAPVFAVLLTPLTGLGLTGASLVWLGVNLLATALGCALLPVRRWVRLATFGTSVLSVAFLSDINLGSVNAVLLCGLAMAWRWSDSPLSGLAMALSLSIRPYLATVIAAWALWRRWRAISWTLIAGAGVTAAAAIVTGPSALADFLRVLGNVRFAGAPHNGAAVGLADALGLVGPGLLVVTIAAAVVALAAILLASRFGDQDLTFAVAVGASLLASPVIWVHYLMLLAIPAAFLAHRGRTWGLALPLLAWLPWQLYPIVVLIATWAPFLARRTVVDPADVGPQRPEASLNLRSAPEGRRPASQA